MDILIKQLQSVTDRKEAVYIITEFINNNSMRSLAINKDQYFDILFLQHIFSRSDANLLDKSKCVLTKNVILLSSGYLAQHGELGVLYNNPYMIHLKMKEILKGHIVDIRYLLVAIDFEEFNEAAANEFIDMLIQKKEQYITHALKQLYLTYKIDLYVVNWDNTPGNVLTKIIADSQVNINFQKYPIVKAILLITCQTNEDDEDDNLEKQSKLIDELVEYDGYVDKLIKKYGSERVKKEYAYKKKIFSDKKNKIDELENKLNNIDAIEILKNEIKNDPTKLSNIVMRLLN